MTCTMVNDKGQLSVWEIELIRDREAGEWVHYSDDGLVCFRCGKLSPFVWVDSEYKYDDHHKRCELRGNHETDQV